ncbi:hypothetical protein SAMN05216297_11668 [Flavobacterium phragmitis]|uniref:Uncharacterized protein n=1 Tax=Flavobacterium phragmitis TaxID=739143 RepID=A0A1I1WP12_9FLAO|nr:hypothetical protein SAMN05216297_11668 [Flavobacterium phragmitis]
MIVKDRKQKLIYSLSKLKNSNYSILTIEYNLGFALGYCFFPTVPEVSAE